MEEDKLYNDLKNHIGKVFDEYDDTTADEGWLRLREKYPEQKDKRPVWLWYAAAAVVLLCLGLWFFPRPYVQNNTAQVKPNPTKKPTPPAIPGKDSVPASNYVQAGGQANHATVPKAAESPLGTAHSMAIPGPAYTPTTSLIAKIKPEQLQADSANKYTATDIAKASPTVSGNFAEHRQAKVDSPALDKGEAYVNNPPVKQLPPATSAAAMNKLLAEDVSKRTRSVNDKTSKRPVFSVYAATYFNYAKGSDNQMNVGAGISSDFKLSKNLRLTTGIAIAQNSLNYNNTSFGSNDRVASDGLMTSASGHVVTSTITVSKNYAASLVGLDVPINLKYEFNPQNNDTYISAGLSSGTFINETYTTDYNYGSAYTLQNTTRQSVEHKSFNGFDVAKTLNVAFGIGYPLGKSNRLIIEPFLKYPLDGLGSEDLRFGAGGINLKLNFQSHKK